MKEIWKDIPGYEGHYQVSNLGQVKSLSDRFGKERILKPCLSVGYYKVCLTLNKKHKQFKVHKLVAIVFLVHTPDDMNMVVNHIDNNRLNNHVDNLELVSNRYNTSCHRIDVGISWETRKNKWRSQIQINGNDIYLGSFTDKELALQMYQKALNHINIYEGDAKAFRNALNQL